MQINQLFDLVIHVLEQDSKKQAVKLYVEKMISRVNDLGTLVCYEPDITNQVLEPSVFMKNNLQHEMIKIESAKIDNLDNPISFCYVMKKTQKFIIINKIIYAEESLKEASK